MFESIKDVQQRYNNLKYINQIINKPNRTAAGYHWCTDLAIFDGVKLTGGTANVVVYCYETKERFNSIKEASLSKHVTDIFAVLNKPNRTTGDLHWCTDLSIFDGVDLSKRNIKQVFCYETKERFKCIGDANIRAGSNINESINKPNRTTGGYHWCTDLAEFDRVGVSVKSCKILTYCYETKEQFNSIKEAGVKYNTGSSSIGNVSNNPNRTAGGYHWCTDLSIFDNQTLIYPDAGISGKEKELVDYIKSLYSGQIIENSRSVISPLELDIYLPELKLAFEFNGIYWHNEQNVKSTYHINKTNMCNFRGIQLIHIFEHQWDNNTEVVKSLIRNKLRLNTNKIYARKCTIKEVSTKDSSKFLNDNHMQGSTNSKVNLGLYYNDELVSVMTFSKPRFNQNIEWELNRFCSKLDTNVVGAAGKLLKFFERNIKPKSMISYANLQWSYGELYKTLGFELSHQSNPNYWWTKAQTCLSRYACQKHKLEKLLPKFDATLSETENMKANGYSRLYDCGNLVFIKNYS